MPSEETVEEFLFKYRFFLFFILIGIILIGLGISNLRQNEHTEKIEVLSVATKEIVVEISGEIINPGVYKLSEGSRIDDLLIVSGGLTLNADREYVEKNINRAEKLIDGKKYYFPTIGWQNDEEIAKKIAGYQTISSISGNKNGGLIGINSASLTELDTLPGIGQKYGISIIEHRPYSNTEELVSKGAIPKSVFEKIKNQISTN